MNKLQNEYNGEEVTLFINQIKYGVWLLGVAACLFAITAIYASVYSSSQVLLEALITLTLLLFITWLYLRPEKKYQTSANLRSSHLISQEYILPYPYLCQIYHLLNLKHLETIHNFSLSNLKIGSITQTQTTSQGGIIKFRTSLDSDINPLRIWRSKSIEVDLILHNPYTVELSIPVYGQRRFFILFNVLPLTNNEHYFFIDIYGDLQWWLKPLMQILLHFAAALTLFEDLPYLQALSERNIDNLFLSSKFSTHETMYLYNRYVELAGNGYRGSLYNKKRDNSGKNPTT
jgi:hypothetical protein